MAPIKETLRPSGNQNFSMLFYLLDDLTSVAVFCLSFDRTHCMTDLPLETKTFLFKVITPPSTRWAPSPLSKGRSSILPPYQGGVRGGFHKINPLYFHPDFPEHLQKLFRPASMPAHGDRTPAPDPASEGCI